MERIIDISLDISMNLKRREIKIILTLILKRKGDTFLKLDQFQLISYIPLNIS